MRKSRFTEEQIIGILKEHEAGAKTRSCAGGMGSAGRPSTSGRQSSAAWKHRRPQTAGSGGREPAAEEAVGRAAARQCGAEGSGRKKLLTPRTRHAAVRHVVEHHGLSERRATRLLGVDRSAAALPAKAQGRRGGSRTAAGAGGRTAPVRLPAAARDGQTQGATHEPEEGLPAVSRGGPDGSPAAWSQAGDRHAGADEAGGSGRTRSGCSTSCRTCWRRGRRFRVFNVEDQLTRDGARGRGRYLAAGSAGCPRRSIGLVAERGKPEMIVSDNGTELTVKCHAQVGRGQQRRMALHRAWQAAAERLHGELQRQAEGRVPGDHINGCAVPLTAVALGQAHLAVHAANPVNDENDLGGCVVDIGHHLMDDGAHDALL